MGADGAWMIEVGASSSIRSMRLRLAEMLGGLSYVFESMCQWLMNQ